MTSVATANPGSLTAALITGGKLGTTGTDIFIKVMRWSVPWSFGLFKTTGDGDNASTDVWEVNYLFDFGVVIDGLMVATSAQGFLPLNIKDTAKNPITTDHKLFFSSNQVLNLPKTLIYGGVMSGARNSGVIRVMYHMKLTEELPSWSAS